ncbi:MAG: XrtA/PEP-CTERM system TPR-repeat protein PrsT [Rubrivivax sp.]|jgi:putative PEP-CTERM system TPR-repeat lipoprotein
MSPQIAALTAALAFAFVPHAATATPQKSAKYYEDALNLVEKNDLAGASVQLKNALKEDNKNLAAQLLLGRLMLSAGELKGAEATLEGLLKQGVSKSEVVTMLGQVYLQLGDVRKLLETVTPAGLTPLLQSEVMTLRGSAMAMSGNFTGAAQAFTEARNLDPKSALPYIAEAPALLRAGERARAKAVAIKATELAPNNPSAWSQLGSVLLALGEFQPALAALDKGIALNGKHVDSRIARATVLVALKRTDEAGAELKLLKEAKVVEPRASFLRASLAAQRGDAAAAKIDYTEAASLIDAIPLPVKSNNEPLLLSGALAHRALGNAEKTREYLEALLSRNGGHIAGQTLLASVLLESNQLNRAVPIIENLLRANPDDVDAIYMMGSVYLARKQYVQASEYLDKAARMASGSAQLRDLSFSQFALGQNKVALANLEQAYARNPKDLRAGVELAVVYARLGDAPKALRTAEALVKLDPNNLTMLNFLGNVKGRLGDKKGLRQTYEQALAKNPKFRPVVMNMSWLDIEEGRFDDARTRLLAFLKDFPKDPDVIYQLGLVEQAAGRNEEALARWTEAEGLQQKDPRAGLAIVEYHLSQRQIDKALSAVKLLSGRYPDALPVTLAAARAFAMGGDLPRAKQALQDATSKAGADPVSLVTIGRLQMQIGHLDGASYNVGKALQSSPNDLGALALQVEVAGRRGNASEVDKAMAALQAKHPDSTVTQTTAGHIAFSRGQVAKAVAQYKGVFDREPNTQLALTLAQAYTANNDTASALKLLETWQQKNPRDVVTLRAVAEMQLNLGKTEAGRKNFEALVKASPNDPSVAIAQARALLRINDPGALAAAERAYKLAPQLPAAGGAYGWALVQKGDLETGVRILREARLREPGNGQLRWQLAQALTKAGRKTEAREELRAAMGAQPLPAPQADMDKLRAELGG